MQTSPKVFISHASEDRQRFVEPFAKRLRQKGVDAWVYFWEMLPGDRIVGKIFDEGLKPSDVVIVVLSKFSVEKPWVREELDYAIVRRIEGTVRLIPVRLDQCNVPEALKTTLWIDIPDLEKYDAEFDHIMNSIFGQYKTPPLGDPPAYVQQVTQDMEGLSKLDSTVFTACCKHSLETASLVIDREWLAGETEALGISETAVVDTQEVLENRHYVRVHWTPGPRHIELMEVTEPGFNQFARTHTDYKRAIESVARMIVRDGYNGSRQMTENFDLPQRLIEHALFVLENNGFIRTMEMSDGEIFVEYCSPELRRKLEE